MNRVIPTRKLLIAAGVIVGWTSLSVVSNWKEIRHLYCEPSSNTRTSEVNCRAMKCRYPHYFFVPSSDYWEDKGIGYHPRSWCVESVLDEMNK